MHLSLILACASTAAALCPMGELTKRGLAPADLREKYERGEGLGTPDKKRGVDELEDVLAPLGIRSMPGRAARSEEHIRTIEEHFTTRFNERDADVDIDAAVLTPKAHRRYVEKRGAVAGVLAPLTGPLAGLDVPTPQAQGLKAIPGDDKAHRYIKPGKTDVRGLCPTLNTLANHGYLNRNGITTFAEAANAVQTAYAIGYNLAVFLSAVGLLSGGDIPTGYYSIGGRDKRVPETLGVPLYGEDRHGLFEVDGSINRADRYFGDDHSFNITRWNLLVEDANKYGDGLFNDAAMKHNAAERVEESRANNPEFSFGGNFAVVYATRSLLTNPLPNGTAPDVADFKNIAPFYLNETFPDNWFRVPKPVSLAHFALNIGEYFLFKPQPFGANVNGSFIPANITAPSDPAAVGCLGLSLLASAAPNEAQEVVQAADALFNQVLSPILASSGCDTSIYVKPGSPSYTYAGEDTKAGSGSGITHPGEWDSKSKKPTGKSKGEPTRKRRSFRASIRL